jgi:hypothetical protein
MKYLLIVFTSLLSIVNAGEIHLEWNASPSSDVINYNIYYGTSSRVYTNTVSVGNVTNTVINKLNPNILYYFAATSTSTNNEESQISNEASAYPYELKVTGIKTIDGYMNLSFDSLANHFYTIEASTNLTTWSSIYTTKIQTDKSTISFIDMDTPKYSCRFYRIKVD